LGSLCSQNYIPLFAMGSSSLRLEVTLVDSINKAFCCTNGLSQDGTISLNNVEYVGSFIELNDTSMSMIKESLNGEPLQFVIPDYRSYPYSYALTENISNQVSMPINAKFSSLKNIIISVRDKLQGTNLYFPDSSVTAGLTSYSIRIGSNLYPQKSPDSIPEYFCEVLKAISNLGDLTHQPSIDLHSYSQSASISNDETRANVQAGSFYIGLDLENYSGASKDSIFAGYNSNTEDCYAILNFTPSFTGTVRLDAFANFDSVIVCENNTCYVKF